MYIQTHNVCLKHKINTTTYIYKILNKHYRKQNEQSRDTGNIGHTRHRRRHTKNKNTTQHRKLKKMSNTDTTKKLGVNPGARKG